MLFAAILLSIPDQTKRLLGVEVLALAILSGAAHLVLDRRAKVDPAAGDSDAPAHALATLLDAVAPKAVTSAMLVVAGALLVFNLSAGLDLLVPPVLVGLAGGVASAWLLLTKIAA